MRQPPNRISEGDQGAAHLFAPDLHDVRHLWLKAFLLTLWALASFGVCYFARDLMFAVDGWPLGFWMASQGAVFVFLGIAVAYAAAMSWFERQDALCAAALMNPDPCAEAAFAPPAPPPLERVVG